MLARLPVTLSALLSSSVSVIASFAAKAAYNMVANERHTQHTGARADGPSRPDPHSEMLTHDSLAILTQLLEELLLGFDLLIAHHRQLGFSHLKSKIGY